MADTQALREENMKLREDMTQMEANMERQMAEMQADMARQMAHQMADIMARFGPPPPSPN